MTPPIWNRPARLAAFALASTSIACLLGEFYGLAPMRTLAGALFAPASLLLVVWTTLSLIRGGGFGRHVVAGAVAGLVAAVAYDLFRVPFVFADEWGLEALIPRLPLFKVFPRFGALLLGEPSGGPDFSAAARAAGWGYHFSNGATFGVMYLALIGDAGRRSWLWALPFAAGLEAAMLFTPYPAYFGIRPTAAFVAVTLAAHLVFGAVLGLSLKWWAARFSRRSAASAPASATPSAP